MSTRKLFTTSFQSPYVSLDLLSYVKSGLVTPFQIFNEVIMPAFESHISKDKPLLTEYDEKHKSSSSTNSDLQKLQKIQSNLIDIGEACGRLKQWEDLVNHDIRKLVLQSLDVAFKERTEEFENSTKTNFLHNKLDEALHITSTLKKSLQSPSVNLNSESFRLSMTRAEVNLSHSSAEPQDVKESSAFKETEAAYKNLDQTRQGCFLCFSVFPEDAIIKKKVLVHWWVSEKFGDDFIDEEKANEFFKEFTERGLIKPVYKKWRPSADCCTMDPATRDAVIDLAKRERFFNFDADRNPTEDFTSSGRACLVKTEEGSSILELPFHLQQENVQSMINVNEPDLEFRPDWFSKMKNVRVLQLGRWQSSAEHLSAEDLIQVEDSDFLKGLKNMRHLRYLSLRGVSGISELPAAVCKLSDLRILNLNGCLDLEKIPQGIGSLKNLTHLDMYECYLMSHMPKGLALLSKLQVLKGFVIDEPMPGRGGKQPCKLADLSRLQHLRKLSIHVDIKSSEKKKSNAVERELDSLADFKELRSLSISWSRLYVHIKRPTLQRRLTNKVPSFQKLTNKLPSFQKLKSTKSSLSSMPPVSRSKASGSPSGPVRLEKLNLHYFPDSKIPDWLMQWKLDELKKLHIRGGKLSDLRRGEQCQRNVEVLRLKFLEELQMDWPSLQELFPKLNYLEIDKCPKLSSMPCDHEGVWEKADSKQEEASNSNHH